MPTNCSICPRSEVFKGSIWQQGRPTTPWHPSTTTQVKFWRQVSPETTRIHAKMNETATFKWAFVATLRSRCVLATLFNQQTPPITGNI
ncbi:hypothetical protein Ae201684_014205 [Aphanomyces euteiches]|uniref:Uncharacterized protein n=1 Tax=Aphanomyces euteiches TaxID=100861 RepID=A0A6G0WKT8_9STRA|nr:hypothetical protein Ae201684_014205 [Aphanomyces euteiches]